MPLRRRAATGAAGQALVVPSLTMCSLSRYLLVGWLVAIVTTTATGSDALGWGAGAIAAAVAYAVARRNPGRFGGSCALPARPLTSTTASDSPGRGET